MNGHRRQLAVKLFKLTESQVATPVGGQMNEASTSCVTMRQPNQQPKGAQPDCLTTFRSNHSAPNFEGAKATRYNGQRIAAALPRQPNGVATCSKWTVDHHLNGSQGNN